jgi:hypothetical protein
LAGWLLRQKDQKIRLDAPRSSFFVSSSGGGFFSQATTFLTEYVRRAVTDRVLDNHCGRSQTDRHWEMASFMMPMSKQSILGGNHKVTACGITLQGSRRARRWWTVHQRASTPWLLTCRKSAHCWLPPSTEMLLTLLIGVTLKTKND